MRSETVCVLRVDDHQFGNRGFVGGFQMSQDVGNVDMATVARELHVMRRTQGCETLAFGSAGEIDDRNVIADAIGDVQDFSRTVGR